MKAINWNKFEDELDKDIWDRLVSQFWLPEKIALSNDVSAWNALTKEEKKTTSRIFGGLTLLDTLQSNTGAISLMKSAKTQHEEAVLTNIAFMESVHAKSYSNIFTTFLSSDEINDIFRWIEENQYLQYKAGKVAEIYNSDDELMKKAASVLLESFLFYSGFYIAFYWSGAKSKMNNTADMIALILRDEALHGYYIGQKFKDDFAKLSNQEADKYKHKIYELLLDLYENEEKYTEEMYDELGLTEDVKSFIRYNGNKALDNLGFDHLFAEESTTYNPAIAMSIHGKDNNNVTHDFFSSSGSTYLLSKVEATEDSDWDNW